MTPGPSGTPTPHILITNAYTWHNKGDAAIILGMLRALKEQMPQAVVTILSFTPQIDGPHYAMYHRGVHVYSSLLNPYPYRKGLGYVVSTGLKLIFNSLRYVLWAKTGWGPLSVEEAKALNSYRTADVILSCGGGFLGGRKWPSLVHIYGILFGALIGRPVIIYAQSVEPFSNSLLEALTKFALKRTVLITAREEITLSYLRSLDLNRSVTLTADAAFLVESVPKAEALQLLASQDIVDNGRLMVGMTVRKWGFPGHEDRDGMQARYLWVLAETITYLVQEFKGMVVLFPQVIFGPRDDDRVASRQLREMAVQSMAADGAEYIQVLEEGYSPPQIKGMIGEMDLFIGTRMHSNIFALSMNVPTIALSYEKKSEGIMRMLGLEGCVLPIDSLSMAEMRAMISKTLAASAEMKAIMEANVRKAEDLARRNAELVKEFLEGRRSLDSEV